MSEAAFNGLLAVIVGVIVVTFSILTAIILAWYLRRKETLETQQIETSTEQPPLSVTEQPIVMQQLAQKASDLLTQLDAINKRIEQYQIYADSKVKSRKKPST